MVAIPALQFLPYNSYLFQCLIRKFKTVWCLKIISKMAKSISITIAIGQLPLVNCLLIGFKKADWEKRMGVTYASMEYILKIRWVGTY